MPDTPNLPRVQITNPDEFTQVVPYLVGFTPEESLVIAVVEHGVVVVTARVDIADVDPPEQAELMLDRIWGRFPEAEGYLVAYTADEQAGWSLLQRCADHLPARAVAQTMVVDGDTWHLPDGQSGPADRFGPLAAEASFHGLQRLPSRSELAASFASPADTEDLATRLEAAVDKLPRADDVDAVVARMEQLLRRNLPTAADPSSAAVDVGDAAQLAILAQHGQAREVALLSLTHDNARDHLALWRSVVNHVPDFAAEAPLFLAGMAAWVAGEGAQAAIALERSEQVGRPGLYRPALLLSGLIDQVVPPSTWGELRAEGLADAEPRVRQAVIGTPAGHTSWETLKQHPLQHPHQRPDAAPPAPGIAI